MSSGKSSGGSPGRLQTPSPEGRGLEGRGAAGVSHNDAREPKLAQKASHGLEPRVKTRAKSGTGEGKESAKFWAVLGGRVVLEKGGHGGRFVQERRFEPNPLWLK